MGRKWTQEQKDRLRATMKAKYGQKSSLQTYEPIQVPKGSGPTLPGTDGACVCCGEEFKGADTILRAVYRNTQGQWTGRRLCRRCSPYMSDQLCERFALRYDEWPERWRRGDDGGHYGDAAIFSDEEYWEI